MDALHKKRVGSIGEHQTAHYLEQQGFTILECNYACRGGEVDIIALKNDVLAFVEVKTRRNSLFPLSNVITLSKQNKIIATAQVYCMAKQLFSTHVIRFDVSLVTQKVDTDTWHIEYISNAFTRLT